MTTVALITARVVALAGDMTGVTASDVYPSTITTPFCFVEEGSATFERIDTDTVEVTQEWILLFYVQSFTDEIQSEEDAAYQAVRPYLTSVPLQFWNRTRLQRNDQGLADIKQAMLTGHQGIQSASRINTLYQGVAFTLSVVYDMRIDQI